MTSLRLSYFITKIPDDRIDQVEEDLRPLSAEIAGTLAGYASGAGFEFRTEFVREDEEGESEEEDTELKFTDVDSSNVGAVAYDESTGDLHVRFLSNMDNTYVYHGVEPDVYAALMTAPSIGAYIGKVIKPSYSFDKLESE